jgi:hypothetical protein
VRPSQSRRVAACQAADTGTAAVTGAALTGCAITATEALVARRVGVVSTAWRVISPIISSICSCSSGTDGGSTDAYCHSTGYGCTTIDATAIDAAAINASASDAATIDATASYATVINASTSIAAAPSICGGVSGNTRNKHDANDNGCSKRRKGSMRHDLSLSQVDQFVVRTKCS